MRAHYLKFLTEVFALACVILFALQVSAAANEALPQLVEYQLDVSFNGQPAGRIARFADLGDGRFASPASELRELGLKVPAAVPDDELVPLDGFAGVSYVYDEAKQTIAIEISDDLREPVAFNARGEQGIVSTKPSDYGALLNYSVFGAVAGDDIGLGIPSSGFSGVNVSLDGRILTPHGVFNQTAIVGTTLANQSDFLSLDSSYTFSDPENLVTWTGGDFISGGVGWSRPIRIGGLQARRSFNMRPGLVTTPLPAVSGSAAVPSTVDVFVNGVKSYSQKVGAGPYHIDNIPSITGAGVAQVVTTDAAGRETVQSLSFYTSPQLLLPGLFDFSVEAGAPRSDFGIKSFGYDETLVASATLRAGMSDWLTLEAHAEGGDQLWNAGGGVVARALDLGIVSLAASASTSKKGEGIQLYGSFETKIGPAHLNLRSQHSFENYEDLASITSKGNRLAGFSPGLGTFGFEPPRSVDAATLSFPIEFDGSNVSATFVRYEQDKGDVSNLLSVTYSRPLIANATMYATGFTDLNGGDGTGLYAGVNVPLDDAISLSAGVNTNSAGTSGFVEAAKPLSQEPGSWGWRIRDYEGGDTDRAAVLNHRTTIARLEAGVHQDRSGYRGTAEVEGAIAVLGGAPYLSNRVYDSFAVVDAHNPGVKVQRENTLVGETNEDGKILVPNLSSFQKNKISIDPMDLPLNAEIESTVDYVAPSFRSGVYVEFNVKKAVPSAIVILQTADGKFVAAGSEGRLEGSEEPFVVGYDGQAFIRDLAAVNTIHISTPGQECSTQFTFAPSGDVQPVIGPEICQ